MGPLALTEPKPSLHTPQSPQRPRPHRVMLIVKATPNLDTGTQPPPLPQKRRREGRKEGPCPADL